MTSETNTLTSVYVLCLGSPPSFYECRHQPPSFHGRGEIQLARGDLALGHFPPPEKGQTLRRAIAREKRHRLGTNQYPWRTATI